MDSQKGYTIYDYFIIVLNHKKKVIIGSLIIGALTAVLVFFVMPPMYLSNATLQSSASTSGLSGLLSGGLPDLDLLGDLGGGGSQELALYEEILSSRRCIEATIIRFNLMEEFDFQYMQDAVKIFREEFLEIALNKKASTIVIGVYGTSPVKANEMANFMISQLNTIYTELSVQSARNNREFLEERYNLVKKDLTKIEDSLKVFQEIYGVAPDIQIKAAAQTGIQLEAEIISEEVKLDLLRKILTPNQAEIKAQEEKIASMKKQLSDIRLSNEDGSLSLKGAPQILIDYLRLQRDLEIQTKILATILPLYEKAKIEENKETPTVLVLDQPDIPDRKKKPKRLTSVLISLILSSVVLSAVVILYETSYKKLKERVVDARNAGTTET